VKNKNNEISTKQNKNKINIISILLKFIFDYLLNISWNLTRNFSKNRRKKIIKCLSILTKNKKESPQLLIQGSLIYFYLEEKGKMV